MAVSLRAVAASGGALVDEAALTVNGAARG